MTEGIKEEILNTWQDLEKVRKLLNDNGQVFCNSSADNFDSTLQQYQNVVISVGNRIEKCLSEKLRGDIISKLEDYCEEIFQLSQCLQDEERYGEQLICLGESHRSIAEGIMRLPTCKLAVFLPYKYSMWDSLESIYLAADADPNWDAVIMPIPYVEREEAKEPQWIYEGPELYDGMNTVSFKEFLLSEQMPDVIYIHNPYDGYNIVTSVPRDFYSDNLKQYCKKLVYVPYFFNNSELPGIHRNLPTYHNYDYIVVASDNAARQLSEYVDSEKILPLGSPKIDRMLWMEENYTLPEEWSNRIRGRKTVLYNVGLNSLLQNKFQTILKMIYVFNYFKQHQDVVLWWRPHPLIKSTLKTMCPEFLGAYEALESKFIFEKIGIYDVTSDSNRAIAATDAFIGDYSSMCGLYGVVGKPIYLMDTYSMDEPTAEDKRSINLKYPWPDASGLATKDGKYYVYSSEYRALCLLDTDSVELEVVQRFSEEYYKLQSFHVDDTENAKILLFPSDQTKKVIEYRISNNSTSEIDDFTGISLQKYGLIIDLGDTWYIAPREDTVGIFLDKVSRKQERIQNHDAELRGFCETTGDPLLTGAIIRIDDELYQLAYGAGYMLVTNLIDKSSRVISIGDGNVRYSGFSYIDKKFVLYEWAGQEIDIWQPERNEITKLTDFPNEYMGMCSTVCTKGTYAITGGIQNQRELLIFPYLGNMILSLNLDTYEINRCNIELPYEEGQRRASFYNDKQNYLSMLSVDSDTLLVQTAYDKGIVKIDLHTMKAKMHKCLIPTELYESGRLSVDKRAARDGYKSPYWILEDGIHCTLNDMIEFVKAPLGWDKKAQHEASCDGVANADGTCGQKVHEKIKQSMSNC